MRRTTRTSRTTLRLLAALAVLALVAAACGGDDDEDGDDGGEAAEVDPSGVVRYGVDLAAFGGWCLDPATRMGANQFFQMYAIYDGLLRHELDGSYSPALAEEAEIVDARTVRVRLRDGLLFSDGTPFDAAALKRNLDRNRTSTNASAIDLEFMTPISDVVVTSPTEVEIRFSRPNASLFHPLLAEVSTAALSPAVLDSGVDTCRAPVGAGPFRVTSFEPGVRIRLEKNPNYYDADNVRLAGMEFVHVDPASATNALLSGAVDIQQVQFSAIGELRDPIVAEPEVAPSNWYLALCMVNRPPTDNLAFRQALNYALDRDEINEVVFGGDSAPSWSLWPPGHAFHDESLDDVYEHDPDRARRLLAEAGLAGGARFTAITPPSGDGARILEIAQQQWAAVGIDVELVPSPNPTQDFFLSARYDGYLYPNARGGVDKITKSLTTNAFANACDYPVPEVDRLIFQDYAALVAGQEDEGAEIVAKAQQALVRDHAFGVQFLYQMHVMAYDEDRIGDLGYHLDAIALRHPSWKDMYIKR